MKPQFEICDFFSELATRWQLRPRLIVLGGPRRAFAYDAAHVVVYMAVPK